MRIKINNNKKYILSVSGGSDSMALLNHFNSKDNIEFIVAHVNYQSRENSNKDEDFLIKYCKENNIELYVERVNSSEWKGNFEKNARNARYNFLFSLLKKKNYDLIVTGQHLNDRIETFLIKIFSGKYNSNIISFEEYTEINGYYIWRPFYNTHKDTIIQYIKENNIIFCVDETNDDIKYTRNKIRKMLSDNSFSGESINNNISKFIDKYNFLNKENNKEVIDKFNISIWNELNLFQQIEYFTKCCRSINSEYIYSNKHMKEFLKLISNNLKPNIVFTFSKISIYKSYGIVYFLNEKIQNIKITKLNNNIFYTNDYSFSLKEFDNSEKIVIFVNQNKDVFIDNAKVDERLEILNVGTKKISKFFIDKKIPIFKRSNYPVIRDSDNNIIYAHPFKNTIVKNQNKIDLYVRKEN